MSENTSPLYSKLDTDKVKVDILNLASSKFTDCLIVGFFNKIGL